MADLLLNQRRAIEILKSARSANETYKRAKESVNNSANKKEYQEACQEASRILNFRCKRRV